MAAAQRGARTVLSRWIGSSVRLVQASFASIGLDRVSTRLGIALLVVSSIFFAANFADKAWVSYQVARQKQDLLLQIAQTKQQITRSTTELKYMHTRPYYVEAARAFGYVQPGDYQITINAAPAPPQATSPSPRVANPAPRSPRHQQSILRRFLDAVVPGL
jgi:hypothetical protein